MTEDDSRAIIPSRSRWKKLGFRSIMVLLVLSPVCIYGCGYDLHLEGKLLNGPDQTPIPGAKVTLFTGDWDFVSCSTDGQGKWKLQQFFSQINFEQDAEGRDWLKEDPVAPISIRFEADGKTYVVPCPKVAAPESGSDIFAFVLTVLDVEPKVKPSEIAEKEIEL